MFNVYIITNLVNGKQYVGLTTKTIKSRLTRHIYDAKREDRNKGSILLLKAIRKYGKENFVIDLVSDKFTSIQELKQGETDAIKKFNTLAPNGYNLKLEEQGNIICSKELKTIFSRAAQGKKRGTANFTGVRKRGVKFASIISFESKPIYLGTFLSETDAAIAYDINAIKLHGNMARLNFEENRNKYIEAPELFSRLHKKKKPKEIRFKGIKKHGNKWITINSFKTFTTQEDAAIAYDVETIILTPRDVKELNFPQNLTKYLNKDIIPNYYSNRKKSKYRGVSFHKNKWTSRILIEKKCQHLGYFSNEIDAAIAYDIKALSLGNKEKLNFPENIDKYNNKEILPNHYKNHTLSKYRGVTFDKNKWLARISINKKIKGLGYFLFEEDAAKAYNVAAIALFGDKAKLNIIKPH